MHREPLTPFGGRLVKLAHVVTLKVSDERSSESVVHKWRVLDAVIATKERLGVPQRAITVLSALLSFHPEAILSGDRLLVFPSNQQLSHRTQGMAHATLRRHLASLVDAGLIIRRDSPNGKRYARRSASTLARLLRAPMKSGRWPKRFSPSSVRWTRRARS